MLEPPTAQKSRVTSHPITTLTLTAVLGYRLLGGYLARLLPASRYALIAYVVLGLTLILAFLAWNGNAPVLAKLRASGKFAVLLCLLFIAGCLNPAIIGTQLSVYGLRAMTLGLVTAFILRFIPLAHRELRLVWMVLIGLVVANVAVGLRQAFVGLTPSEISALAANGSTYLVGDDLRVPGLLATGQEFSLLAGGVAAWAVAETFLQRRRLPRWGAFVLAIFCTIGCVVALQRGPLVALAASLLITAFTALSRYGRKTQTALYLGMAAAGLGAIIVAVIESSDRSSSVSGMLSSFANLNADTSYRTRTQLTLPTSLHLVRQAPLGGYGTGASGPSTTALSDQSPLQAYPLGGLVADNGYLQIALQIGVIGALVFALLLFSWLWVGGISKSAGPNLLLVRAVISYAAVAMLFGGYWGLTGPVSVLLGIAAMSERQATPGLAKTISVPEKARGRRG